MRNGEGGDYVDSEGRIDQSATYRDRLISQSIYRSRTTEGLRVKGQLITRRVPDRYNVVILLRGCRCLINLLVTSLDHSTGFSYRAA